MAKFSPFRPGSIVTPSFDEGVMLRLMKKFSAVFLLAFFVGLSATGKTQSKPTNGQTPLTTEELMLYGDFLDSFLGTSGEPTSISFSDRTVPLILDPGDKDQCLQGVGFKISGAATQIPHLFPASIANGRPIYLVDPNTRNLKDLQSGLLSVSEIGFDNDHRFAVFTFRLVRSGLNGSLYKRGGTLVFRKIDGKWVRTNKTCLDWMT